MVSWYRPGGRLAAALVAATLTGCVDTDRDDVTPLEDPAIDEAAADPPGAHRIDDAVIAIEIPVAARVHVAPDEAANANSAVVGHAGQAALARFGAADRARRRTGASTRVVDARWLRDVGPSADGRGLLQEWKVTRVLDGHADGVRPGDALELVQPLVEGQLDSCRGVHGLEGRRAILFVEVGEPRSVGRVSARLIQDEGGDLGALYPRTDAAWVWAEGASIDETTLLAEVSTWR